MIMNKRLMAMFLFLLLSVASMSTVNAKSAVNKSEIVSVSDAEHVALKFIDYTSYRSAWSGAQLNFSENLYDIDETLLGYYFLVTDKSGSSLGHIIVSATKDRGPILQYGDGVMEGAQPGLKGYYVNGIVHAADSQKILKKAKEKNIQLKTKEKDPNISGSKWDRLLSYESTSVSIMSVETKELGLPRYYQRGAGVTNQDSACGPTTGAMITDYLWYYHNVPRSSDYGGVAQHINHLYPEMNTTIFGSSLDDFSVGLLTHLRHYGERWVGTEHRGTEAVAWNTFRGDIDMNLPVGIRFDYWVSGSTYTNYHYVAGEGYMIIDGTPYFAFKDPDGNNPYTIYQLWSDNYQDIGFLHLWKQA
jgi:hypothetical protein